MLKPGGILVLISLNRWFLVEGHDIVIWVEDGQRWAFDPVATETGDAKLDCSSKLLAG